MIDRLTQVVCDTLKVDQPFDVELGLARFQLAYLIIEVDQELADNV